MVKLSHIAIACPDIGRIEEKLRLIGLRVRETHSVPTERVNASMIPVEVSEEFRLELLEPTDDSSPIQKFLEKRPAGGLHHICFEVEDLVHWHRELTTAGLEVLPPGIRNAARGRALFIHPKSMGGVLVELEEITKG